MCALVGAGTAQLVYCLVKSTGAGVEDATDDVCDDEIECRRKPRTRDRTELDVEAEERAEAGRIKGSKDGL